MRDVTQLTERHRNKVKVKSNGESRKKIGSQIVVSHLQRFSLDRLPLSDVIDKGR